MTEIKVKAQFSLSELMAEFEKTKLEQDRDALTAREIGEMMGWSNDKVDKFLYQLQKEGRLGVTYIQMINRAGWLSTRPAYYVKDKTE